MSHLIQNAIYWPAAGLYLKSSHQHDYFERSIELSMGLRQSIAIDGGTAYRRLITSGNPVYEDFSLYEDSPFDMVADRFLWGTYGKDGKGPFKWVPLKECETDHLQAILKTQIHVYGTISEKVIKHWLNVRSVKPEGLEITALTK